ncbi:UvrD-helicase domain-containing protein [Flavobacterium sp.]|uniref:UvrD-helicase domain-containing protein n=1 Tax=Flavobacterium sp. TaxID=239 RepID=UPI003753644A
MVERKLESTEKLDEFQQIMEYIRKGENFLLSGGAGSGKTYSLVQVIRKVIAEYPTTKVACMTYTNAAVKQIEERVNHDNLKVTTIHDFLWDNIKNYQKELKKVLIELINDNDIDKIKLIDDAKVESNFYDNVDVINYSYQRTQLLKGIISHDELLIVANRMFKNYKLLCDIVKDKFKFIFIDEYQDSHQAVVEIFLEYFTVSEKKNIIGFFGDAMQSIYDDGIGNLKKYLDKDLLKEVIKVQNRRNPKLVIDLANRLRTDGIVQEPSNDLNAPNMQEDGQVKSGKVIFIHSKDEDVQKVKDYLKKEYKWHFSNPKETKELNLTHNLIAGKAGFRNLMDIYDKDPIVGLKRDILKRIKENREKGIPEIEIGFDDTFDIVVNKFELKTRDRKLKKDVILANIQNLELYNKLKNKSFSEVRKIYLDKDSLIDDKKQDAEEESKKGSKRDKLIKHLFKIQTNIFLYQNNFINDFIKHTEYKITRVIHKKILSQSIQKLTNVGNKSIEDIINLAHELKICLIDYNLEKFKTENEYVYNRVKDIKYKEFQDLYNYLEGKTPFSTQHKVKGDEFDNVLVVLDNGNWNDYNFEYLFTNRRDKASVLERTQKIFYVCCTRSKENLAVFYHNPSDSIISKAEDWFGKDCVIPI